MRTAFKEWAIVVDALGHGIQIIILRKGGISEGVGGFTVQQPRFLLFPTLFHQQRESVIPSAQARYDQIAASFPPADRLRLEYFAEVAAARSLATLAEANSLRGQHIWRDDVIVDRFEWGRDKLIFALAVRVFRLPNAVELPMISAYGGCKSWIEVDQQITTTWAEPVLSEAEFGAKLVLFNSTLNEFRPPAAPAGPPAPSVVVT